MSDLRNVRVTVSLELVRDATGWVADNAALDQAATGAFVLRSWSEETARAGGHYRGAPTIWHAPADRVGRVSRIDGVEKVRETSHVRDGKALVDVGAEVKPTRSSIERVARVRVVAPDASTAIARASILVDSIDVVTEPVA